MHIKSGVQVTTVSSAQFIMLGFGDLIIVVSPFLPVVPVENDPDTITLSRCPDPPPPVPCADSSKDSFVHVALVV